MTKRDLKYKRDEAARNLERISTPKSINAQYVEASRLLPVADFGGMNYREIFNHYLGKDIWTAAVEIGRARGFDTTVIESVLTAKPPERPHRSAAEKMQFDGFMAEVKADMQSVQREFATQNRLKTESSVVEFHMLLAQLASKDFSSHQDATFQVLLMGGEPVGKSGENEIWRLPEAGARFPLCFKNGKFDEKSTRVVFETLKRIVPQMIADRKYGILQKGQAAKFLDNAYTRIEALAVKESKDWVVSRSDTNISLIDINYPELRHAFQLKIGATDEQTEDTARAAFAAFGKGLSDYRRQIEILERGYSAIRSIGDPNVTVKVPGFGEEVNINFDASPYSVEKGLARIQDFSARLRVEHANRLAQAFALRKDGFDVDVRETAPGQRELVVAHRNPAIGTQTMPLVGAEGFPGTDVGKRIASLRKQEPEAGGNVTIAPPVNGNGFVHAAKISADGKKPGLGETLRLPPIPEDSKVDIVLDTKLLNVLGMNRKGGSWTDLLDAIAAMPTVNRIIVPSHIADWELRGKVPMMNEQGKHQVVSVDPNLQKLPWFKNLDHYLQTASRSALDADGRRIEIPGANPKVVIWESREQQKLAGEIRRIQEECRRTGHDLHGKLDGFRKNHGADAGERAAVEFCRSEDSNRPAIIVTEDVIFATGLLAKSANHSTRLTTPNGRGVGTANVWGTLEALDVAFGDKLAELLPKNYGGEEKNTRPERIIGNYNRSQDADHQLKPGGIFLPHVAGKDRAGRTEETLETIFALGAHYLLERPAAGDRSAAVLSGRHGGRGAHSSRH